MVLVCNMKYALEVFVLFCLETSLGDREGKYVDGHTENTFPPIHHLSKCYQLLGLVPAEANSWEPGVNSALLWPESQFLEPSLLPPRVNVCRKLGLWAELELWLWALTYLMCYLLKYVINVLFLMMFTQLRWCVILVSVLTARSFVCLGVPCLCLVR